MFTGAFDMAEQCAEEEETPPSDRFPQEHLRWLDPGQLAGNLVWVFLALKFISM